MQVSQILRSLVYFVDSVNCIIWGQIDTHPVSKKRKTPRRVGKHDKHRDSRLTSIYINITIIILQSCVNSDEPLEN